MSTAALLSQIRGWRRVREDQSVDVIYVMSLHKLSAGDGYTYLTRQVARHDAQGVKGVELAGYYSERGEAPGQWIGAGVAALGLDGGVGSTVGEEHMRALFGEGIHPEAERILAERTVELTAERFAALGAGRPAKSQDTIARLAMNAAHLGRPFRAQGEATEFTRRCAQGYVDETRASGYGVTNPMPDSVRSAVRTDVAKTMFRETYGREADAREIAGFIAKESRSPASVAGFDLTFSPVKSISTLWAVAPLPVARTIERAHEQAVAETLAWVEDNALYTRQGRDGVRQVKTNGMVAAAFVHRDSRAGDPDLHTHVAVSNKVQARDGVWRAIDGRVLFKAAVAASERYNTALEANLRRELGVRFEEMPAASGKRAVREIVGVDQELMRVWSARRAAITTAKADLDEQFRARHGRPPTPKESIQLAQQANLMTRQQKHEPRSLAEQRQTWREQAVAVLGEDGLDAMITAVRPSEAAAETVGEWTQEQLKRLAADVLSTVETRRATWQRWHVEAEAARAVRAADLDPLTVDSAIAAVTRRALGADHSVPLGAPAEDAATPAAARREDGTSMYRVADMTLFSSRNVLDAEARLRTLAGTSGARALDPVTVQLALLESAANGLELNPGQAHMVTEMATSGRRVQLAIAPAGSGKTTAMNVLARAWHDSGGDVVGLSPTAAAAAVLSDEIGVHADTLAKLVWHIEHASDHQPGWMQRIGAGTLVILDEAGMASTRELDIALGWLAERGAAIRLVGDDQQLSSVSSGGVLRDIAEESGALTLAQLMRFSSSAEAAATLALRAGDVTAIGYYLDHHRVDVGPEQGMVDTVFAAWQADVDAGADSLMLAPRRDMVTALNLRARAARLAAQDAADSDPVAEPASSEAVPADLVEERRVWLADGLQASAGDLVITRRNDRSNAVSARDYVRNGYRWRIESISDDGSVTVQALKGCARTVLSAEYVKDNLEMGYASTIHAAQGMTADRCRVLADDSLDRQLLYVALTRGRHLNALALVTVGDGDEHASTTPAAVMPETPTEILEAIIRHDGAQASASTRLRESDAPEKALHEHVRIYSDALLYAAENLIAPNRLEEITEAAFELRPDLADDPAWPLLRGHLALIDIAGQDTIATLVEAIESRELDTARSTAAILDYRLGSAGGGPLPWLRGIPIEIAQHPEWGPFLTARAATISTQAAQIRAHAASYTPATAPEWVTTLGLDPTDSVVRPLAVWRAAMNLPDTEVTPTGPARLAVAERQMQDKLDKAVADAADGLPGGSDPISGIVNSIAPRILKDPVWPVIHARLGTLARSGVDVAGAVTTALHAAAGTGNDAGVNLPDDHAASGLWWRIAENLGPAVLEQAPTAYRPAWADVLDRTLGPAVAGRVQADRAWGRLLAAVNVAQHAGLDPDAIVEDALAMTPLQVTPGDGGVAPTQLTRALTARIVMLTQQYQGTPELHSVDLVAPPLTPEEEETLSEAAPQELHAPDEHDWNPPADEPSPVSAADEQWYAQLLANDPSIPTQDAVPADALNLIPPFVDARYDLDESATSAPTDQGALDEPPEARSPAEEPARVAADRDLLDTLRALIPARRTTASELNPRLLALIEEAQRYYESAYPQSWGSSYLRSRLGTDTQGAGYAPSGWTHLADHLRRTMAATDDELLAAGLARRTRRGGLIDAFRDRLTFPLVDAYGRTVGFVARRNPDRPDDPEKHGPKYRNTENTELYHKGSHLFGLDHLAAHPDATLVLVEGPLDALAITTASQGRYVGVASLGTALTPDQANILAATARPIIVATDNDAAGTKAAANAYWALSQRGITTTRATWDAGSDPAQALADHGPTALVATLDDAPDQAHTLVNSLATDANAWVEQRVAALREAARVIAAQPPTRWQELLHQAQKATHTGDEAAQNALLEAASYYNQTHPAPIQPTRPAPQLCPSPAGDQLPVHPPATETGSELADTRTETGNEGGNKDQDDPAMQWRDLAAEIDPRLPLGRDWTRLAHTISALHHLGIDPREALAAARSMVDLPSDLPAAEMRARLLRAHPDLHAPAATRPMPSTPRPIPTIPAPAPALDQPSRPTAPQV